MSRFLERIGLGPGPADARYAWKIVLAIGALYAIGFAAFYPQAITNDDEAQYLRQARLLLQGRATIDVEDPLTGESIAHNPSTYPVGNALLMAPWIALGSWKAGYMVTFLSLMIVLVVLARWLHEEGRSPIFALLLLGYPPALVMGRVAMSDVPSAALVTVGLFLFWRGIDRGWGYWLASGLLAGAGLIFRESNPIAFAPFFAGALLRRDRNVWALVVGGLLGVSLRLLSNQLIFGDPFYQKAPFQFALGTLHQRLPLYLLATLVFVPGGFILALCYRGRRWPELCTTVGLFVLAYLVQRYWTYATSTIKLVIITPRYLIPIVPVMAFGMAEAVPRLWRAWMERAGPRRARLEALAGGLLAFWVGGITLTVAVVHPAFDRWSESRRYISETINAQVAPDAVMITNLAGTRKYIHEIKRSKLLINRIEITVEDALGMIERYQTIYLVFLDRSDSEFWRRDLIDNTEFLAGLRPPPELLVDERISEHERLRIWRVGEAAAGSADGDAG